MIERWLRKRTIWVYTPIVDFRKQLDGLIGIIATEMDLNATDALYLFRNRKRDKIKRVFWDRNGFGLGYKRLERGRFDFPIDENDTIKMDVNQLAMLLSGMPLVGIGKTKNIDVFLN